MDSAKLSDWIQIVGTFAIVASLIFVGIEVRQSSIATRSATNAMERWIRRCMTL